MEENENENMNIFGYNLEFADAPYTPNGKEECVEESIYRL